ncbi:MAG TPA: PQQ-binding-like beta-propeller repeat protein [Planctomycetaceae bacterium]|nr:PQQ-binding-like beta-propeller repeat protein [Planctomycetaceae bacterium]
MLRNACVSLFALTSLLAAHGLRAGDWPQILGPQRNGIAAGEKLIDALPAAGLKPVWQFACGSGLAGVAVADGRVILFHRQGGDEVVTALDAETGQPQWSQKFPSGFEAQIVDDDGPRCVPTIADGRVFAYGAEGRLIALDAKTGKPLWNRATHKEFGAPAGYFGAGSSPLVDGNRVIVNVGGPKGAGVVAFDVATGKTAWQATDELASYSAPIRADIDGQPRLLVISRSQFLGLDPATGKETFRVPFGARGPTVNGASPVLIGSQAFLTASYGVGAKGVQLAANKATVAWEDESLSSQYTTPIVHDGAIYGIDGRQDAGSSALKCLDAVTRKSLWTKAGLEYATLVAADGKLLVMHTNGELRLVKLDKSGYHELGTANLLPGTTRGLPALSQGRWYIRNERTLACFSLAK